MPSADKMAATEVVGDQQQGSSVTAQPLDTVDSLRREAEQLKAKLEEERAKLTDVDRKIVFVFMMWFQIRVSVLQCEFRVSRSAWVSRSDGYVEKYTRCNDCSSKNDSPVNRLTVTSRWGHQVEKPRPECLRH